jgi:hypothetical protein
MIVTYGGVTLAPGGLAGEPGRFRINQTEITEPANFFRAAAQTWFARGNSSCELGFEVPRQFNTLAAAWLFIATHSAALAGQADLVMTAGDAGSGTQTITLPAAVLSLVSPQPEGVSVIVSYVFRGGQFST